MSRFQIIAFDADDTLWETERLYVEAQGKLKQLLARYHPPEWIEDRLYQTESRNMDHFGYGIKAFALSMIETAVELSEGRVTAGEVKSIIDWAKEMLSAEVELIEHVDETIALLAARYPLMLITKGDLRDQERKIERSRLAPHFSHIEIVSDKNPDTYRTILLRHALVPERFVMVGNSLRSDVLPVLEIGSSAVYIPHKLTWAHEAAERPSSLQPGFYELEHIGLLPALLERLEGQENDEQGEYRKESGK